MDLPKLFNGLDKDLGSNLTHKIGNPPKIKTNDYFCVWSDLLGFGNVFFDNNWTLTSEQKMCIYQRLQRAHSIILHNSSPFYERNLILNDGFAKVFRVPTRLEDINSIHLLSLYLRSSIENHIRINETEKEFGYAGCRTVLSFGEGIEYLSDEIRFDDYVANYTKPKGQEISSIAKNNGNPVIIYNPKELQMNIAFSKAYTLESGGSRIGIKGNRYYIEESVLTGIQRIAENQGFKIQILKNDEKYIKYLVPYKKGNNDNVVLGFNFSSDVIETEIRGWKTKVYRLLNYYPHDEKISEFSFELE